MMENWGSGWGWGMMSVFGWGMMLVVWGGLAALVVVLVRAFSQNGQPDGAAQALRRRLAAGEITPDDYERTRKLLQG